MRWRRTGPSRTRRCVGVVAFACASAFACTAAQADSDSEDPFGRLDDPRWRPRAEGALAWVLSDDLDVVGDLGVEFRIPVGDAIETFAAVDTTTAIERATSDLQFIVRELDYTIELGIERDVRRAAGLSFRASIGQLGEQRVDLDGSPYVRFAGIGATYARAASDVEIELSVDVASVLEERDLEADALGRLRATVARAWRRAWLGLDFELDALIGARAPGVFDDELDVRGGPYVGFRTRGGRRLDIFLHGLRARQPLGLRTDGVIVGFRVVETAGSRSPSPLRRTGGSDATVRATRGFDVDGFAIDGVVGLGRGGGRSAGRLALHAASPAFGPTLRVVLEVDANVLGAADTGDLYYFYDVGLERPFGGLVSGAYYYHRSNHTNAEPNPVGVTSIDVFEAGIESPGYLGPPRAHRTALPAGLDLRVRAGWLVRSDFGEDRRWHARAGVRYRPPFPWAAGRPIVQVELERGDVERDSWALGWTWTNAAGLAELRAERRVDEQWFSSDRAAWLLMFQQGF